MRRLILAALLLSSGACRATPSYLFVWAGDSAGESSDFLGVIDADSTSPRYGAIVASVPTGEKGTHPHHTEAVISVDGHLLANGFHAGKSWLFDLTKPLEPKIITSFGDLAGLSHPHTFVRLADGNLLTTFQYQADSGAMRMSDSIPRKTGGLVEMDERGTVLRSGSAVDSTIADRLIYPYSVLPIPTSNLAVSTTSDMNPMNAKATDEWVQIWRLSDLTLLRSVALPAGPRGNENRFTGEPFLLADGESVYIHTFSCGMYLLRGIDSPAPRSKLVHTFEGTNCGVPILAGHYWLQTVPDAHALVTMDVTDPENPKEVSRVVFGESESPHWLAIDHSGRRLVMNSAGGGSGNRLFVINFDPAMGRLTIDGRFHDPGSSSPGVSMTGKRWPHGFAGKAVPHGTVFSQ